MNFPSDRATERPSDRGGARVGTVIAVLALIVIVGLGGCGSTQVIDRDGTGRAILIRSPQPDRDALVALHDEHEVATVVNLRGEHPEEAWFADEAEGIRAIGAEWVHLRMSGRSPPQPEQLAALFDLVEDADRWPILVHCAGGVHRTGAVVALYRIQYQGWDNERALREMDAAGFGYTLVDRSRLREFVRTYERDPARSIQRSAASPGEAMSDER